MLFSLVQTFANSFYFKNFTYKTIVYKKNAGLLWSLFSPLNFLLLFVYFRDFHLLFFLIIVNFWTSVYYWHLLFLHFIPYSYYYNYTFHFSLFYVILEKNLSYIPLFYLNFLIIVFFTSSLKDFFLMVFNWYFLVNESSFVCLLGVGGIFNKFQYFWGDIFFCICFMIKIISLWIIKNPWAFVGQRILFWNNM